MAAKNKNVRYLSSRKDKTKLAIIPDKATDQQVDELWVNTNGLDPWRYYEIWCSKNNWMPKYKNKSGRGPAKKNKV